MNFESYINSHKTSFRSLGLQDFGAFLQPQKMIIMSSLVVFLDT